MSDTDTSLERLRLIADIGGTNARFALLTPGSWTPCEERVLACADYPDPVAAIETYLAQTGHARPTVAALALATAITGDQVRLTNHSWAFSLAETRQRLGLERLYALNDFTALALALPYLEVGDVHKVGGGEPVAGAPLALLGPGTGLGVSGLIPLGERWQPLSGEGGHVTFSPADEREAEIVRIATRQFPHVSAERLLNGAGLVVLYRALAELNGQEARYTTPADITAHGLNGACALSYETVQTFCAMLGTVAGNLALTLGARGGVYIGGGIVPKLGELFEVSPFRRRFEQKGRLSAYVAAIPCYVIHARYPAFLGLARAFA